jgi:hypothetical protein
MPLDLAIERLTASARELTAAAEKTTSRPQRFGSRLAQAVKRKSGTAIFASSALPRAKKQDDDEDNDEDDDKEKDGKEENDSFSHRIKKAVEKRSGQKQHKEYAERERERYEEQRKRALGE